jgi:hypothetical protein
VAITEWGYAATFVVTAAFPVVASPLVPRADAPTGP